MGVHGRGCGREAEGRGSGRPEVATDGTRGVGWGRVGRGEQGGGVVTRSRWLVAGLGKGVVARDAQGRAMSKPIAWRF